MNAILALMTDNRKTPDGFIRAPRSGDSNQYATCSRRANFFLKAARRSRVFGGRPSIARERDGVCTFPVRLLLGDARHVARDPSSSASDIAVKVRITP